jgi:hypothetical protein
MAQKAKACADVLIQMYTDRNKPFILTKKEFTAIAGKGKMRKKYLVSVDECLRKQGYVLLDVHKELQIIGVLGIETIAQWDIPDMHHDTHEQPFAEDKAHDDVSKS